MKSTSDENRKDAWSSNLRAAEAHADRLSAAGIRSSADVDALVDRVISGNRTVTARLERDIAPALRATFEQRRTTREGASDSRSRDGRPRDEQGRFLAQPDEGNGAGPHRDAHGRFLPSGHNGPHASEFHTAPAEPAAVARFTALRSDLHGNENLVEEFRSHRAWRTSAIEELVPKEFRPRTRPPIVTRGGVFYIAPRFEQAVGIGEVSDARLIRAGIITAQAFLDASNHAIAELTGHSVETVMAGKRDFDLTRLTGVDAAAADILRYLNVHSISRLAQRDSDRLAFDLQRVNEQYRFWDFPRLFSDADRVRGLIEQAARMVSA